MVLNNVNNFTLPKRLIPKVMHKIRASYLIVKRVFKDMYKLDLPPEVKVHPTFHVSFLKPFKDDTLWHYHKQVITPPPKLVRGHLEHEVRRHLQV